MLRIWLRTVETDTTHWAARSSADQPSMSASSTCRSRSVSRSNGSSRSASWLRCRRSSASHSCRSASLREGPCSITSVMAVTRSSSGSVLLTTPTAPASMQAASLARSVTAVSISTRAPASTQRAISGTLAP